MIQTEQQKAARKFSEDWKGKGYEKGESQKFWLDLLCNVFGIEDFASFITFEDAVKLDHTSFIDGYITSTKVLIEQKSIDKDLKAPIKQSDNTYLTPFQQAKRYITELPVSKHPRWVITCNFKSFLVYDMEKPSAEPEEILLKNLEKEVYRLSFITDEGSERLKKELEVSKKAGEIIGEIYDAILLQYHDANNPSPATLKSLNMLCVRLVFCLYAEDAGIFGHKSMFGEYLKSFEAKDLRRALLSLFQVLDQKIDERDEYLEENLAAFPYVNGGLFTEEDRLIPQLTQQIKELLVMHASSEFDWNEISPTIFGAIFESTLNPETRRSGGMHYTSIENIHKVIDPLFMNELKAEFEKAKATKAERLRNEKLFNFQKKLGSFKFLDPACGSGNFLTESYLSLRHLENECIKLRLGKKGREQKSALDLLGDDFAIHVKIEQFYGIEINDFAVVVAKTALWIAESQMMSETARILGRNLEFLPLKSYTNIIEGNALRLDWESVLPKSELSFIMGNPPFVGARLMNAEQKKDIFSVWKNTKNIGNVDYVSCWYKKSTDFVQNTNIKVALVSTNSITQGEQVSIIWKPLFAEGIHIDFAHRTFRWDSESNLKAHVHCVIIGFSSFENEKKKIIFVDENQFIEAKNINGYLIDGQNVFVKNRNKPLCNVPPLLTGSQRIDNNNFIFDNESKTEFIKKEPKSAKYFKVWYGADEFIKNKPRWCLYLGKCSPTELIKMPACIKIIEKVKEYRLASKRDATVKAAAYPSKFGLEVIPESNFIVIPVVSSEKRRYIPIGFMNSDNLCSNQINLIPDASIYHFGILTSSTHMAWIRIVCGRLEMRYRYSKDIVYNNFPWCDPTDEQKYTIEKTAKAILDARAKYPESSLADMYGEHSDFFADLVEAHRANDRAVMEAYGFRSKMTESECVAKLFKMYEKLIKDK